MLDTSTKRRIDTCRDILVGKVPDPKSQVEQITVALIYKFMDDMDLESEELGGARRFFTQDFERYRWSNLIAPGVSGQDMLNTYSEALVKMVENERLPALFRSIFRNAYLPYRDPETLRAFLREIDTFTYDHSEKLGDAFEYLLSVLGSQGDAGQFRTPRHVIDFMVEIIDPQKGDVILDPACGTAGFLISAYKHILKSNSTQDSGGKDQSEEGLAVTEQTLESPMRYSGDLLTAEDRERLARNIKGYDISPDMVRLSLVNLYLHGFADPKIEEYDTLTSEAKWTETADVILANPPFMSPKGGIKPHTRFQVPSKRSEVLFVDYMAEHLNPNGRAAIVVPEGIIFQSQKAYVALRKMLVDKYLAAVISLPAGVFNPYSGVKTSILILDRAVAKASDHVAFFKVENDGFALGAQRKAVKGSQLAQVTAELSAWLAEARMGAGEELENSLGGVVERARLAEGGGYNLSAERYAATTTRTSHWPMVKLGEVVRAKSGNGKVIKGTLSTNPDGNLFPAYSATGQDVFSPEYDFDEKGIVVSAVGARCGKCFMAAGRWQAIANTHVIIADETKALTEYLFLLLNDESFWVKGGSAQPFVKVNASLEIEIPLPPLEVQREIVAEIESYQRVIDGARAVTDNYRPHIPVDPEWPVVDLGDVCDLYQPKTITSSELKTDGEFVVYGANGIIGRYNKFNHEHPEVLVTCRGATCGTINMSQPKSWVTGNAMVATPKDERIDKSFLHSLLLGSDLSSTISGSAQPQITRQGLSPFKMPLPSRETQTAIVAEIEAEQALVNANRELIARFETKIDAAIARVWGDADKD